MARYVQLIGWDDCPHLQPPHTTKEELDDFEKSLLPHQRKARRTGIPSLGAGAIYPVDSDELMVTPFRLPDHWPKGYGLDVGWNKTAAIWCAKDIDQEFPIYYLIGEYYQGHQKPAEHTRNIKLRGEWMFGACDPAARASNQRDGQKLRDEYIQLGLHLRKANNAVEAGILHTLTLMQEGRLKIFTTCHNWLTEFRLYRRDENGKIVKAKDHLMDATRYILNTDDVLLTKPMAEIREAKGYGSW